MFVVMVHPHYDHNRPSKHLRSIEIFVLDIHYQLPPERIELAENFALVNLSDLSGIEKKRTLDEFALQLQGWTKSIAATEGKQVWVGKHTTDNYALLTLSGEGLLLSSSYTWRCLGRVKKFPSRINERQ